MARRHIWPFTVVDGTHKKKSRCRMILLIVCRIDANDQVIPLAWALVPVDLSSWNWFLRYLKVMLPSNGSRELYLYLY